MTEGHAASEDAVRRLAEIRAEFETDKRLRIGVGHLGVHVPYLLSLIDSLTAERDEAQRKFDLLVRLNNKHAEVVEAERDELRVKLRGVSALDLNEIEKLKAEVKRLREALGRVAALADAGDATYPRHDREALARLVGWQDAALIAMAALAAPPSEEGQHQHTQECYSNYNDPVRPYCGLPSEEGTEG